MALESSLREAPIRGGEARTARLRQLRRTGAIIAAAVGIS